MTNRMHKTYETGYTLLETVLYISLTTLVLVGAVTASFGFIQASNRTAATALREQEIAFVSRKLDWLLGGAVNVSISGTIATITNPNLGSDSPVQVGISDGTIYVKTATANAAALTPSRVAVTSSTLPFAFNSKLFTAVADFSGEVWSYTYYVR